MRCAQRTAEDERLRLLLMEPGEGQAEAEAHIKREAEAIKQKHLQVMRSSPTLDEEEQADDLDAEADRVESPDDLG